MTDFYAGVQLANYVTSKMYTTRYVQTSGTTTTVTSIGAGTTEYAAAIRARRRGIHFLTRVIVQGSQLSTNWIAPVVMDTAGGVDVGSYTDCATIMGAVG